MQHMVITALHAGRPRACSNARCFRVGAAEPQWSECPSSSRRQRAHVDVPHLLRRPGGREPAEERDDERIAEVQPQTAPPSAPQQQPQEVAAVAATVVIPASASMQTQAQSSMPIHTRKIAGIPIPEDWSMEEGDVNIAKGGKGGGRKSAEEKGAKGGKGGRESLRKKKTTKESPKFFRSSRSS